MSHEEWQARNFDRTGSIHSEEWKQAASARNLAHPIAHWKGKQLTHAHRQAVSAAMKVSEAVYVNLSKRNFRGSNAEQRVWQWLESYGVRFRKHIRIASSPRHEFDIAVPEWDLLIEVDGCYWHRCPQHYPNAKLRHELKSPEYDSRASQYGWTVAHIWEHDLPLLIDKESQNVPSP